MIEALKTTGTYNGVYYTNDHFNLEHTEGHLIYDPTNTFKRQLMKDCVKTLGMQNG